MALNPAMSTTQWLDGAGKVLRFYAFFKEAVLDSQTEAYRVRKVCLLFYLSDGTMEVTESKAANSGIAGGAFLKRSHVPNNATGTVFAENDFKVGGDVQIFGRTFHIYDCDGFTRDVTGGNQGEKEEPPMDPFTLAANTPSKPLRDPTKSPRKNRWLKTTGQFGSTMGSTRGMGGGKGEAVEPTTILRYYAKWIDDVIDLEDISGEDPKTPRVPETTDKRQELYKIHFYLEDGSLEILVSNKKELKYQMYPTLLSRQLATKTPMVSVGDIGTDKEYVTFEDFKVGQEVIIQNRRMLIYKSDERTYKWIEQQTGVDMRGDEFNIVEEEEVEE